MLVQVFQNLVGNAVKYRSEKTPQIHISAAKNSREEWVFSVRDNGIRRPTGAGKVNSFRVRPAESRYTKPFCPGCVTPNCLSLLVDCLPGKPSDLAR